MGIINLIYGVRMRSLILQDKAEVDRNVRAVTSDYDSKQV